MARYSRSPRPPLRLVALLAPLLVLIISTSGCIQTEFFKDVFFKEEDTEVTWGVAEVVNMHYRFTESAIVSTYPDQQNFMVRPQAKWLIFSVEVRFHILDPTSIADRGDFDLDPPRDVTLVITDPDGVPHTYVFESTGIVNLDPILNPEPGLWRVRVDARGRGLALSDDLQYFDEFSVLGRLNQPQD